MRRREFIRHGSLAWLTASFSRRTRAARSPDDAIRPVVASTWRFGIEANRVASRVLRNDGSVLDAVQQGVMIVEGDPRVTSVGYGGLPNREGVVELDAALMDGSNLGAGSVAGLRRIKHPVAVARKVMEQTPHVLLVGEGARRFAATQGFEEQDLLTAKARKAWERFRADSGTTVKDNHDTIGLVAMDLQGRMAAACTTSGLAWKLPGRVGDSPLIGHGLYCDTEAGAAVATGMGEEIIRVCGSYQIVEFMRRGAEPEEAIRRVLERIVRRGSLGDEGNVSFVALRADGAVGYASIRPGFQAAISRGRDHRLMDAPSLS